MTKYPKKTNCPACGIVIRLKYPKQSHYHECTCGEWFFYEPIKNPADPQSTRLGSGSKIISPRITKLAGPPPSNSTAPKVTVFKNHLPPVQPKTSLNLVESVTENGETTLVPPEENAPSTAVNEFPLIKPKKSSKPLMIVSGLFILAVLGLITTWLFIDVSKLETEEKKRLQAQEYLKEKNFLLASVKFDELASLHPESAWNQEYLFLGKIATLRNNLESSSLDSSKTFDALRSNPLSTSDHSDLGWLQYLGLIHVLLEKSTSEPELLNWVEQESNLLKKKINDAGTEINLVLEMVAEKRKELARIKSEEEEKARLLSKLKQLESLPPHESFRAIQYFMEQESSNKPDAKNMPECAIALEKAKTRHFNSITYEKNTPQEKQNTRNQKTSLGWQYFQHPLMQLQKPNWNPGTQTPVFSLNHGVLYALDRTHGNILWIKRLGIDVNSPPLYIPDNQGAGSTLLTLENNGMNLAALDKSGNTLWSTSLGGTCLAGVSIWQDIALIPCIEGYLIEVELAGGNILGRWKLGQSLIASPCLPMDSNSCYIPADPGHILCLDLATKKCFGIIVSEHVTGTLVGPPIPIFLGEKKDPTHLLLTTEEPGPSTTNRIFQIPTTYKNHIQEPFYIFSTTGRPVSSPVAFQNRLGILDSRQNISFFAWSKEPGKSPPLLPFFDEKNQDKPLSVLFEGLKQKTGSSQLLAFNENEADILYNGNFCKILFLWNLRDGLKMVSTKPPFHQTGTLVSKPSPVEDASLLRNAWSITGKLSNGSLAAQLIDPEKNKPLWKTMLSPVFNDDPIDVSSPMEKNLLLLADKPGNLFLLKNPGTLSQSIWNEGGICISTIPQSDHHSRSYLMKSQGSEKVVQLLQEMVTKKVSIKLISLENNIPEIKSLSIPEIGHDFAGHPKIMGNQILVPLTDGNISRIWVKENNPVVSTGPTWRLSETQGKPICQIAVLDNDMFCFSDGASTSFFKWNNLPNATFEKVKAPQNFSNASCFSLDSISAAKESIGTFLSPSGEFFSFQSNPDGSIPKPMMIDLKLTPKACWNIGGATQPPRTCILSTERRLCWVDPVEGKLLWDIPLKSPPLVKPFVTDKKIIIFLQSGEAMVLEESSGKLLKSGLRLPEELFPSSSPWQGAGGTIFIPFIDGTILQSSLKDLMSDS